MLSYSPLGYHEMSSFGLSTKHSALWNTTFIYLEGLKLLLLWVNKFFFFDFDYLGFFSHGNRKLTRRHYTSTEWSWVVVTVYFSLKDCVHLKSLCQNLYLSMIVLKCKTIESWLYPKCRVSSNALVPCKISLISPYPFYNIRASKGF